MISAPTRSRTTDPSKTTGGRTLPTHPFLSTPDVCAGFELSPNPWWVYGRRKAAGSSGGRGGGSGRLIRPPKHDVRIGSQGLPTIPGKKELPISFCNRALHAQVFSIPSNPAFFLAWAGVAEPSCFGTGCGTVSDHLAERVNSLETFGRFLLYDWVQSRDGAGLNNVRRLSRSNMNWRVHRIRIMGET